MPHLFAHVVLPNKNNLAEDAFVNGFHFTGVSSAEAMTTEIFARLASFYEDTAVGAPRPLNQWMSTEINFPGARLKIYDWDDPKPRAPIFDESLGLVQGTPVESLALPGEVALCLSYAGPIESGGHPARRRGRVYIGPLNTGCTAPTPNASARPAGQLITTMAAAGEALADASTSGCSWVVWSTVNSSATVITRGWVDNAFDTQRRRGVRPSGRTTWEGGPS